MAAKYRLKLGDQETQVEIEEHAGGVRARINGVWHEASIDHIGNSAQYAFIFNGRPLQLFAEERPHGYLVVIEGRSYDVTANLRMSRQRVPAQAEIPLVQSAEGEWVLASPMAGVVQKVLVSLNDLVQPGDVLMIIEAMKMQNELRARHGGQVKAIYASEGQQVEQGTPLLVLL
jgi:biotin carboxyl carrier protein